MPSPDRTLSLSYVIAATLLLHVLLVPLWAAWLDRPADASVKPPLKSKCSKAERDTPSSNRHCLPGKSCPITQRQGAQETSLRLTYLEETSPPEPPPEPPKPPEPLLQTVSAPVDPSQSLAEPEDARFAATQSASTDKETVKHSNDLGHGGGPKTPSAGAASAPRTAPKSSRPSKPKGHPDFEAALQRETFAADSKSQDPNPASPEDPGANPTPTAGQPNSTENPENPESPDSEFLTPEELVRLNPELIANHLPATPGSGGGTIDYLNEVEEGDRTLLNRKRTSYATFFERVQSAIKNHWDPVTVYRRRDPTGRVYGVQDRVTILNVTLNSDGSIASLGVRQSCGLDFLDDEAVRAVNAAGPFPNPPEGLKDINGKIKFSFGFYFELSSGSSRLFRFR